MNNVARYFCGIVVLVGASLVPSTCSETAVGSNDPQIAYENPGPEIIQVDYIDIEGQGEHLAAQY